MFGILREINQTDIYPESGEEILGIDRELCIKYYERLHLVLTIGKFTRHAG